MNSHKATAQSLTPAQVVALRALRAAHLASPKSYTEATALGASPAALSALVRKGLARTSTALHRAHGWDVAAYRITLDGNLASVYLPRV